MLSLSDANGTAPDTRDGLDFVIHIPYIYIWSIPYQ